AWLRTTRLRTTRLRTTGPAGLRTTGIRAARLRTTGCRPARIWTTRLRAAWLRSARIRPAGIRTARLRTAGIGAAGLRAAAAVRHRTGAADAGRGNRPHPTLGHPRHDHRPDLLPHRRNRVRHPVPARREALQQLAHRGLSRHRAERHRYHLDA